MSAFANRTGWVTSGFGILAGFVNDVGTPDARLLALAPVLQ
jgi:hypothetical protein